MQQRFSVDIDADPGRIFALVADLGTYDRWLDLVHLVEPAQPADDDPGPAWWVTLRARLGPLARSKRLRMVRTRHVEPRLASFERREIDDRHHSAWILTSSIEPGAGTGADDPRPDPVSASTVTMELRYDGGFWSPVLDGVLGTQVAGASESLRSLATTEP